MFAFVLSLVDEESDKEYITKIYYDYSRLMNYVASGFTSSIDEREEIIQESLIRLINKIDTIRELERKALVSYIAVTVKHTSINYLRKKTGSDKQVLSLYNDCVEDVSTTAASIDERIILKDQLDKLSKIWPELSETDRFLLEGKYICGYTNREMADTLGCKEDSIRMKLTRARRNALKQLTKEGVSLE